MIEKVSIDLSKWLSQFDNMPKRDVMKLSLKVLITNTLTVLLIVLSGIYLHLLKETVTCAVSFAILRKFTSGYHIKSAELCIVASTILVISLPFISDLIGAYHYLLNTISLVLIWLFAAYKIEKNTLVKKEHFFIFKVIATVLILLSIPLDNPYITTSFFIQCLLLIPPFILERR